MPDRKTVKSSARATNLPPLREAFGSRPASSNFADNMNQFGHGPTGPAGSDNFDDFGNQDMDFNFVDGMFNENMDGDFESNQRQSYMDPSMFGTGYPHTDPIFGQFGFKSQPGMNVDSQYPNPQAGLTAQSGIVNSRKDQVREQFGQITPPDDNTPETDNAKNEPSTEDDQRSQDEIAKQNRAQRARNAANKRHSKSKKRKDSTVDDLAEDVENDPQSKTTSLQREKNRVAAAKCRAKKKATSEEMQDVHREGSKTHTMLQREMRELRDQKAFLRNTLLQHEPGVCGCHAIHCYNLHQAQQLAIGVGAMIPQAMSPSQGSASSIATPGSDGSGGRQFWISGPVPGAQRPSIDSLTQSSSSGVGHDLSMHDQNQNQMHDQKQLRDNEQPDVSQMTQSQFNEFLENSESCHPHFS